MKMKKALTMVVMVLIFLFTYNAFASSSITIMSNVDAGIDAYGPLTVHPSGPDDQSWGTPIPAVLAWAHPLWQDPNNPDYGLVGARWISTSFEAEPPYTEDTWRKFTKTLDLCSGAYNISGMLTVNSDDAELVYVNGIFMGEDVTWKVISDYTFNLPDADSVRFDFIVQNIGGSDNPIENPTGLIFKATVDYECPVNHPPVADPNGPYLAPVRTPIEFDGAGSYDPDGDALTYTWDFGDGRTGTGPMPSHSYSSAGIYEVCLTVNDGFLDSEEVCTLVVIFDPSAGFVTGGGWIDSPEGAYKGDPSLSGKATFGFVSKYKKGARVPHGNTEFQFKAGDLNFHSSSYEWLVVAGKKATFKGEGTINGQGSYKFMIRAYDDNPDSFRIQIWDDTGTIYDNGSQQELGGGSIVIHKN